MDLINVFIVSWLFIMGVIDIKKKAIPLIVLIIFSGTSILLKIIFIISDNQQIGIGYIFFILLYTAITIFVSGWGQVLGLADMVILGILAFTVGIFKAAGVLLISLFLASVFAAILLILKKAKAKDQIAFIPFVFLAYMGVVLCG